jgi:hypothetical protein
MLIIDSLFLGKLFFLFGAVWNHLPFLAHPQQATDPTARMIAPNWVHLSLPIHLNMAKKACKSFRMTATTACSRAFPLFNRHT